MSMDSTPPSKDMVCQNVLKRNGLNRNNSPAFYLTVMIKTTTQQQKQQQKICK
jgi:hypothetical protein